MRRTRRRIGALLASALAVGFASTANAATRFDPALRFRVVQTEHFLIYFHQNADRLAERLAAIAEETWTTLSQPLGVTPPRLTHVVLADQTELANGYATPLPYDTIVIYSVWPPGSQFDFDDWLRLAFTHEFTHIIHLDRSESWARVVRGIFGRTPYAFPNLFLPPWQVEGLATYEESAITGFGRLHAGDFRAIVGEAARHGRLEPLDRVNGGLTDWPGGAAPYAYGVGFHEYLVDRFGARTLAQLAEATARRVPYTASRVFKRIYGESLGTLWRDYESSLAKAAGPSVAQVDPGLTRLTDQGFSVSGPRFDRYVCAGCAAEIVYAAVNPHGFPAIYRVRLDGSDRRRLATRYLGSTSGLGRDAIYFDQVEARRNVGVYSDLFAMSRVDGRVRQLTSEARLLDPDLSPDGTTLVCAQDRTGQRDLALVAVASASNGAARIVPLISEPDTHFDAPKWSPDGRTIAVERHRLGALPEIVIIDVATKAIRVIAAEAHTRFVMPAWRPDGTALVVAAGRDEETFNLFEVAADGSTSRQLTHTTGGTLWPDVSPDGRTLVFAGYTIDGYDLFTMPYPEGGAIARRAGLAGPRTEGGTPSESRGERDPLQAHDYSPLSTLKPTSWSPVIETASDQIRIGAATQGFDVLGYHVYAASATWLVSAPSGAPTPNAATPDWQVYYAYDRWRPTFYAAASSATSFFAGPATAEGTPADITRRERQIEGGVILPIRHVRVSHAALFSVIRSIDDFTPPDGFISRARTPVRAAWQTTSAKSYGYSISPEDGIAAGATAEFVRRGLGSPADATTLTADARAYLPGLARHHVIALRAGGGASIGDPAVGRTFLLGGDSDDAGVVDFGSRAFTRLRGFGANTFAGSRVAVTNAEYRWPIARPQRGVGTWPFFLAAIHGAAFVDAGYAWTRAFNASTVKTAVGAELSVNIVAAYFLPLTFTAGAAWGHDGGGVGDRATLYVRIGKSF